MCGINGFNFKDKLLINDMNDSIKYRGPDDQGFFFNENLSLGQVRLSIVDLSDAGHQPMFYSKSLGASNAKFKSNNIDNSDYSITFNGEIYNYLEIKKELIKNEYEFATKTDTEVILAAYDFWGENCVNKFNGMWAFCIYNKKKQILFCSRDRLGVKPFYYYLKNGNFIFSSELKGILKHKKFNINIIDNLNLESVELFFASGFIPFPKTIYNNVFKLAPRENLIFCLKKNIILKKWDYYHLPKFNPIFNKKNLLLKGREILDDATKIRMRSDVEVGAFLSGGVDSSTVVSIMKNFTEISKLHTFSIGFEGKYDESHYINIVKNYLGSKHHHKYFKKNDYLNLIDSYLYIFDEPFSDYSGFPSLAVSNFAKKSVTVSLSGDGGDEIFGGYANHINGNKIDNFRKIPKSFREFLNGVLKNIPLTKLNILKSALIVSLSNSNDYYLNTNIGNKIYLPKSYKIWLNKTLENCMELSSGNLSEGLRIHDLLYGTLPDKYLPKVDRTSMKFALEIRSPFLDYRFMEFSQLIPTKYKVNFFQGKILLKNIVKNNLPNEILYRKKQGFTPPVEKWVIETQNNIDYIRDGLEKLFFLKIISKDLYDFFIKVVLVKDNHFKYSNYIIRMFFFLRWFDK